MNKLALLTQSSLGSIYILIMIAWAIPSNEGRFFALIMLFFLGIWQYLSAFIWIVRGDKRRRQYFLWATVYLLFSLVGIYTGLNKRFEYLAYAAFVTLPVSLAIWYQIISYRHYQSMENKKQSEDENGATELL